MTMKLSLTQHEMLKKVARGHGFREAKPFQIGNTNRTADALERRGLIEPASDQSLARRTLSTAWVISPRGRMEMRRREVIRIGDARHVRRHIFYPEPVTDGTPRCIGCGQIDEDGFHDRALHDAVTADLIAIAQSSGDA